MVCQRNCQLYPCANAQERELMELVSILERNISSLFVTAKAEMRRKDDTIKELQAQTRRRVA